MRSIIPFFFAVPYAEYIYAPSLRTLTPPAAVGVNGSVTAPASLTNANEIRPAVFNGPSSVTFHFQKNVAGIVSIDVASGPAISPSHWKRSAVRVALELLLGLQKEDGRLLYASLPFADTVSFTYHCHSLNGLALYYLYSGDLDWLSRYWNHFKLGINYALSSVDATGPANITSSSDGLRFGMGGHPTPSSTMSSTKA
ncbi:hypothetical protein N7449_006669 [Penicillium cf. viridicatum]|uniref:Uncharacterized protein n=1 Tax=Penicillium cf. viridicatum TaxID=2972119 RepID=A0A9W9JFW3_9EURO|nr:hypothetical protein N7449_006669 [Penicillium cf. viridicatum]